MATEFFLNTIGFLSVLNVPATGTHTFAHTVFTITSSSSVLRIGGSGLDLIVSQDGAGDIASLYDLDQNLVPNVSVKISDASFRNSVEFRTIATYK